MKCAAISLRMRQGVREGVVHHTLNQCSVQIAGMPDVTGVGRGPGIKSCLNTPLVVTTMGRVILAGNVAVGVGMGDAVEDGGELDEIDDGEEVLT